MYRVFGSAGSDGRREAQALLCAALRLAYGVEELPVMARTEKGKPYFPGCPGLHFNLSHSGGLCLCAVGDGPVGVDIELVRPRRALEDLGARAFSAPELAWFTRRGGTLEDFYTLWTRKEALAKFTGEGIADVRGVVPPLPGEESISPAVKSWTGEGWRAAVCCAAPPEEIRWLEALPTM